ncbi:hypothetical protein HAH_2363 [Haloarcula hispanica ATCC 33960]|uniref:Uncharacterized protein n=1 Tax=Haloarcula hispanica (strain ATCC 33960 / DSM 4426 / JCM 8911 / NBRC 102182 / NCIMB 2187 / VKM B-1755) TaxID=634497 RepID=G0HXE7_HALHT|nr:hypothetical protein HAH_2363 [Haloarcula hispanica ATCC 33960]
MEAIRQWIFVLYHRDWAVSSIEPVTSPNCTLFQSVRVERVLERAIN